MSETTTETTDQEWTPDEPLFRDYLGHDREGRQILVTIWQNGIVEVRQRDDRWSVWEAPVKVVEQ